MTQDLPAAGAPPRHTNRCYWDFTEARWVCPARPVAVEACTAAVPLGDLSVLRPPAAASAPLS